MAEAFKLGFFFLVERVKEQLKLSLENKNGIVQTGELTVVLDGLVIEPENLTSCNLPPTSKLTVFLKFREKISRKCIKT